MGWEKARTGWSGEAMAMIREVDGEARGRGASGMMREEERVVRALKKY